MQKMNVESWVVALAALVGIRCSAPPSAADDTKGTATVASELIQTNDCVAKSVGGKVGICHATGSATKPYEHITVNKNGCINGHAKHSGDFISDDPTCRPCVPTTCAAQGRSCGIIPDGCGGSLTCNTCAALDQCHVAGTCDLATGTCSSPTQPDGTTCNDGDQCTPTDQCRAGACIGTNPVTCVASDECHVDGSCNPATGSCSNPAVAEGSPCTGGSCDASGVCRPSPCAIGLPGGPAAPGATPDAFFAGENVTVTATAQIPPDPNLMRGGVTLLRLDDHGAIAAEIGTLRDDGTGGDALVGDGTFTVQVVLNEPAPTRLRLAVRASYRGSSACRQSVTTVLAVANRPTSVDVQAAMTVASNASAFFDGRRTQSGADQARVDLVDFLRGTSGVRNAGLSADKATIWFRLDSGLPWLISTANPGTLSSPTAMDSQVQFPLSQNSLILEPFFFTNLEPMLTSMCGGMPVRFNGSAANVDAFKLMHRFGVVAIGSHGVINEDFDETLATGEEILLPSELPPGRLLDWELGRIEPVSRPPMQSTSGAAVWYITPAFIRAYSGSGYPNSLVYVSACFSANYGFLGDAFRSAGASTYFGFTNAVWDNFSREKGQQLFNVLTNYSLEPAERTANIAFASATPHSNGVSSLRMSGNGNLALDMDLVTNGDFEAGDFSGWVTESTPGYDKVVTESVAKGTFAARLGRWDQPYLGTGQLNGPPVPGQEPDGQDYIYQDVLLPDCEVTLHFSYNVTTYDGADYDYLDVTVTDLDTGTVVASPVSGIGGIIGGSTSNWGEYYTTGWQHRTVDLTPARGHNVRLFFGVTQDGYGDQAAAYIDAVNIRCFSGSTP
jgi:hypothetical protein